MFKIKRNPYHDTNYWTYMGGALFWLCCEIVILVYMAPDILKTVSILGVSCIALISIVLSGQVEIINRLEMMENERRRRRIL